MHKVFVSYHHKNDQFYKENLLRLNKEYKFHPSNSKYGNPLFIDMSVDTRGISDALSDQEIRQKIRDEYLKESSVTILLLGTETRDRKHIDWELYSSMYDGKINKKSGILVINLPTLPQPHFCRASHGEHNLYPGHSCIDLKTRDEYKEAYPDMPERIIDNFIANTKISVTNWDVIFHDPSKLDTLIGLTFRNRMSCNYDLNRRMRRQNYIRST